MFIRAFLLRLKLNISSARGVLSLLIAFVVAVIPFIGLTVPDAAVPIGWIDEDNSEFSVMLKKQVEQIEVLYIDEETDEERLVNKLQTGRLEGVMKVPEGFEQSLKDGEFEETLIMMTSPYSTAFEIVAESVGRKVMELWVACYTANIAGDTVDERAYDTVFEKSITNEFEPILVLNQLSGNTDVPVDETKPMENAAFTSLYLVCAFACFYMLAGLFGTGGRDFAQRLLARSMTIERYRLALVLGDAVFLLPCVLPALYGFAAAGKAGLMLPAFVMFALYLIAYGGVSSLLCRISSRTTHMLTLTLVVIVNLFLGSMLLKLPASGVVSWASFILPSRWMAQLELGSAGFSALGMLICAVVYNALPFVFRRRKEE